MENQVQVFHQGGDAKIVSPGSRSGDTSLWGWASLLIPFFYIWMLYVGYRDELKYQYLFRRYTSDIGKLLTYQKPWYIRQSDWPEVLIDLVNRAIDGPVTLYRPISTSAPYKFLNSDKPSEIPQDKWEKLKETASTRLLDTAKLLERQFSNSAEILDFLDTQWPAGLSEANRVALTHSISTIYCDKMLNSSSSPVEYCVKMLTENRKPPTVSTDAWDTFKEKAANVVAQSLAKELVYGDNIDAVANSPKWEVLRYSEKTSLSKLKTGRIAAAEASEKIEANKALKEKLDSLELQLKSREAQLLESERKNAASRTKTYRQLEIIERVIANPSYLDRIEPDDDTFAVGNWELLRKIVTEHQ